MRGVHEENKRPNPVFRGRTIVKCYRIKEKRGKREPLETKRCLFSGPARQPGGDHDVSSMEMYRQARHSGGGTMREGALAGMRGPRPPRWSWGTYRSAAAVRSASCGRMGEGISRSCHRSQTSAAREPPAAPLYASRGLKILTPPNGANTPVLCTGMVFAPLSPGDGRPTGLFPLASQIQGRERDECHAAMRTD